MSLSVIEPATAEVMEEIPRAGAEEVDAAVAAAKAAFPGWRDVSPADRAALLRSLADALHPGGLLHILCFSDQETGEQGPRRISQAELRDAFRDDWKVVEIRPARFASHLHAGGARAWCATVERARSGPLVRAAVW